MKLLLGIIADDFTGATDIASTLVTRKLRDSVFAMEELEESAKLNFLLRGHPVNLLSDAQIAELPSLSLKA
jgi:hypothetical protein